MLIGVSNLSDNNGMTRRRLLIVAAALLVAGGTPPLLIRRKAASGDKKPPKPPPTTSLALGEFLVNLADKEPPRYLKAEIMLEVTGYKPGGKSHGGGEGNDAELTRLRDAALTVLSSQTYDELMAENGKERLKRQLADRLTEAAPEITVHEVLFSSFVMQ